MNTKRVFKYKIWNTSPVEIDSIEMPEGAQILSVQMQAGNPVIYALVNTRRETVTRQFRIVGTGWELGVEVGDYIGTFMVMNDAFVYHVFDMGEKIK